MSSNIQQQEKFKEAHKKKHTAIGKQACETCERTFKESKTLRLHIHQDHENGSDDEGHEMKITGNKVNHDGEEEDKFEKESMVNNDVEAFEEAPGTTPTSTCQ